MTMAVPKPTPCHQPRGFSLVELLVVIAIMTILFTLASLGLGSISQSQGLERAGGEIASQLAIVRQEAASLNRRMELRVIKDEDNKFRILQIWRSSQGGTMEPGSRVVRLPETVRIVEGVPYSPLVANLSTMPADAGPLANRSYAAVPFLGSGEPGISSDLWLTVVPDNTPTDTLPDNFATIEINPVTGRVTTHRP